MKKIISLMLCLVFIVRVVGLVDFYKEYRAVEVRKDGASYLLFLENGKKASVPVASTIIEEE